MEELYGDIGARDTTDVDILVRARDADAALRVLLQAGCEIVDPDVYDVLRRQIGSQQAAVFKGWILSCREGATAAHLDLHADSGQPPWLQGALTDAVWKRARPVTTEGLSYLTLSEEDRLVFLCWHLICHHMSSKQLQDIRILLSTKRDFDWRYIDARSAESGVHGMVGFVCSLLDPGLCDSIRNGNMLHLNRRQRILAALYGSSSRELEAIPGWIFLSGMYDRSADMFGSLRAVLAPAPRDLASRYPTVGSPESGYLSALFGLYVRRLQKRLSPDGPDSRAGSSSLRDGSQFSDSNDPMLRVNRW